MTSEPTQECPGSPEDVVRASEKLEVPERALIEEQTEQHVATEMVFINSWAFLDSLISTTVL